VYEVDEGRELFRRVHQFGRPDAKMPLGQWYRFQRMSPVKVGHPVRFYWVNGDEGGLTRIGLWSTSPVVEVVRDEVGEGTEGEPASETPAFLRPGRRDSP
jgi:hypothetical protein